ncbi:MAG: DUF4124 domain-containing protein [Dokdonella sp.]
MKYLPTSLLACVAVLACGMFGSSSALASGAYSWVDANGVKHYSDQPPPRSAKDPRRLRLSSGEARGIPEPAEEKAGENQAMARAAGYDDDDIKRNCEIAGKNLAALTAAAPLPEGSEDAATREQSIKQAQGQVKLFCN